jgi:phosphatidylglycerol:prolipoprotein diacylglycerol transferase
VILFTRNRKLPFWAVSDAICCSAPIGLGMVRIANFINGELFGRVTDLPWGMVFPRGGPEPRHPSQLYELALEGIVLFAVLHLLSRNDSIRSRAGTLTGVFFTGYAVARGIAELARQPDAHIGFLVGGATMGQLLSVPVFAFGLYLIVRAQRRA